MAQTTITIDSSYLLKINSLSEKYKMNKISLIHSMIDYFEFYQINPNERNVNLDSKFASFEKKLDKVRDTFVSFIREQEKKKLDPLIKQTNESTQALLIFLKEQALTKDDLKNMGLGGRRVASIDNKDTQRVSIDEQTKYQSFEAKQPDNIVDYLSKANEVLHLYRAAFTDLIKLNVRQTDKGLFIHLKSINDLRERVKTFPKITFEGDKGSETYELIDKVSTVLNIADNYCDSFIAEGQNGVGREKLFYTHSINEYIAKFENLKL